MVLEFPHLSVTTVGKANGQFVYETRSEGCVRKNTKNEGWSQYIIENKRAKKRQNVVCQYIIENARIIQKAYILLIMNIDSSISGPPIPENAP